MTIATYLSSTLTHDHVVLPVARIVRNLSLLARRHDD